MLKNTGKHDRVLTKIDPIRREMGLGHEELYRILPRAIENRPWALVDDRITIHDQQALIEIKVFPESARRLGALQLPVTRLEIYFEGFTGSQINEFMQRFDLSFRRGGG